MDTRILENFLAIAREENMTIASHFLHISQPTLSRQMADLERDLGKKLFIRSNKKTTLTEDGMLFRKRAEEIVSLMQRTINEFQSSDLDIYGEIHIGAGETIMMQYVADVAKKLHDEYSNLKFNLFSGSADDILEKLDHGILDFGILFEPQDISRYDYMEIPMKECMGVLMRKDDPFASNKYITPDMLSQMPLLTSSRLTPSLQKLTDWAISYDAKNKQKLNIVATFNLLYNASLMVKSGLGNAISIDGIVDTSRESELCFIPLKPKIDMRLVFVWKKYQVFSKANEVFLKEIKKVFGG